MSLSFEDSLKNNSKNNVVMKSAKPANFEVAAMSIDESSVNEPIMTLDETYGIAAYSGDDGSWQLDESGRYRSTETSNFQVGQRYEDSNISYVDENKNVTIDKSQINLTQEDNSQYIPFEMFRYYDGIDLMSRDLNMKIYIFFVNENGDYGESTPINVRYNDTKIRFGFVVPKEATAIKGKLKLEIQVRGASPLGGNYVLKTKPNDEIEVLESLQGNGNIIVDENWATSVLEDVQLAAQSAEYASANAQNYASQAINQYNSTQNIINQAQADMKAEIANVSDTITENIKTEMAETYYTQEQVEDRFDERLGVLQNENGNELTVEAYVEQEIANADIEGKLTAYATTESVREMIGDTGLAEDGITPISVVDYVDDAVASVDVTDQLGDTGTNEDGSTKTVVQYVDDAIASADISSKLENYYTKDETYTKQEVNDAIKNAEIDLTGYATEGYVDSKVNPLSSSITTNTENISSLSTTIGELQADVSAIDTSPRLTYDVAYNDTEDEEVGENVFVLYEITGEGTENEVREAKRKFTITGGSGGGSSSVLKITYVTTSPVVATVNDKVLITYNFTGTDSSGDIVPEGNYTWKIGSKIIASGTATYGDNTFDATDFATTTEQKFILTITDDAGSLVSKTWKVQKIDVRLESAFNDTYGYSGDVSFNYTPYGDIEKEIHFVLDGEELGVVKTSTSGIPTSYTIPAQTHGSHLLEVYMTAEINGQIVGLEEIIDEESGDVVGYNHTIKIVKDILWIDSTSSIPLIGCATPTINVTQYNTVNIKYTVIDPSTETPEVTWYVDGEVVSIEKLTEKDKDGYYTYSYKANNSGTFVFAIKCREAEKTITINVEKLNIDVSPVTAGLEFDFNPVGYSNNSEDRLWSYNDVAMTVSDNFDWVNGGYQIDENGDQYFCVKAGTNAVINYNLFADDPKKTGKEFKAIFKTKNIRKRDTSFLTCINDGIGLDMKVEHATVYNSGGSLKSNYCEDTIIEYEFNINKYTDMMIVMSYEDGTPSKPCEYTETSSFKQSSPQPITIGSEDCDVHIYRMKTYSISLTDTDIKNNFIADARNANEMIERYNRNKIYTDGKLISTSASGDFNVDALMKAAPDLRYIFLEVPQFTNDKDNKIDDCTVYFRYPAGTRPQDNWTCTGVRHRGQGTSSNLYGYSGRNIDLCMDRDESLFTWIDEEGETVESSTVTLTDTSYPTDYLNIKVNIASSENANNAQLARRFNEYQPFLRYARKKDSRVKDTMEFYNCVVFIRETSTDASVPHREFSDTNWHFYAIGNVGDSKKTDDTRVNNKRDPREHVIEITDADKPLSAFPTGKEGHAICPVSEWKSGNAAYDVLYSNEYVYDEEGEFESFGGKTYEFRYEMKDITGEQRQANIDTWRELYTFIVTSTNEEFYANLKNYFVVDSALYFYLFTERYTMVDNRAKNSFWHYGKVYIYEAEAATLGDTEASYYIINDEMAAINDGYRYDLTFGYDMDTALGIDNTGDYVFSYGKEDTDYYVDGDPSSDYVFRVADSVFFCRLRDLFPSEMQSMFKNREEKNAWDSNSLIAQWDNAQSQFPEELWRLDYERKYYRTYLGLSIDNSISQGVDKTFLIGKFFGRKKYARRAFEINQEMYFATKYFGNKALSDVFWIRGNVPIGSSIKPNYSLTLVPYSDMYVCVQYTSTGTPIHKKVKAGETCFFENNAERMDFVYVYAASFIQEVGDLSRCYVGDNNFSSATRLQKLVIGSTDDGYENTFMKEVLVENNPLLEHLDLRNISGINTVINVSGCSNLKELYAEGTNASGVIFANGGLLQTAHLPKITSLSMKNLNYIEDFVVDGYDNLQTLIVENTPNINTYNIVNSAPLLKTVRLINLNWDSTYQIKDASIFDRLLTVGGIDSSGVYETDLSVLTGYAYVAVIEQKQFNDYLKAWHNLEVDYSTFMEQYPVTFVNYDGSILDVQYVIKGGTAVDPIARIDKPISVPTKESTISTDYTFDKWDTDLSLQIFTAKTITAIYSPSVRQYQIKYVSKGVTLDGYPKTGDYGQNLPYEGDIPIYVDEEGGYKYYLFDRWNKSGFLDGDFDDNGVKTVEAVFDEFTYTDNVFQGKELSDLSPVQLYALTKLTEPIDKELSDFGISVETGDEYSFNMGYDVDYDDVESEEIISNKMVFDGTNYYDTGIKLFDTDKDFVIAMDYSMYSGNVNNATLMQCYETSGSNGFKLHYSTSPKFMWNTTANSITASTTDSREMLIVRHIKGDPNIYVYTSNMSGNSVMSYTLTRDIITKSDIATTTLIFGAGKVDTGRIVNYAIGEVNWCKIWYKDLGESVCNQLAGWVHEEINLETSGFYRYQLYDDYTKESMMSLLSKNLLSIKKQWNPTLNGVNTNTGGWAKSRLNSFLNDRFYRAIPYQIRALIKKVSVSSLIGDKSTDISSSGCYVTIPSLYDVNDSPSNDAYRGEVYDTNGTINFIKDPSTRKRAFADGTFNDYWLRSTDIASTSPYYVWVVKADGSTYNINPPSKELGVLIEISI